MKVQVYKSERSFEAAADEPVLSAARRAGLALPHSCLGGNCGSCRARLVSGEIHYPRGRPLGVSDEEIAAGYVLLCQARARTDLVIETREIRDAGALGLQHLPCRIEGVEAEADGSTRLELRLPLAEEFRFASAQLVDFIGRSGERVSLAILSDPASYRPLVVRAGSDAGYAWKRGELGSIEGPFDPA